MTNSAERPRRSDLPVELIVGEVREALRQTGVAVLRAEPGAGKTTIVPLRLLDEPWLGSRRIVVLEPRRMAARSAAGRMASLIDEEPGGTVGFSTRDDRRVGPATRIEVVTDGILTRRLQRDPSLPGVGLVIFDEFHERHLEADLALALALDVREGLRRDLRLLVMSATLDSAAVATVLGNAPVIESHGRSHPVEIRYAARTAGTPLAAAVTRAITAALDRDVGDVLVFLPGVGEIKTVSASLRHLPAVDVIALHGSLPPDEQDRALRRSSRRRVILSTDLAESSVTVEGVGIVVDSGFARRPAYDPSSGLSRLTTLVISLASADQRAGRAGRLAPGVAYRLWSRADEAGRAAYPSPEIAGADLAGFALELAVWGAPPESLHFVDPPPPSALARAKELLVDLGALANDRPTELGRQIAELPLHPRLASMLLRTPRSGRQQATRIAALLSERDLVRRTNAGLPVTADIAVRLAILDGDRSDKTVVVDEAALALVRRRATELGRRSNNVEPLAGLVGGEAGALLVAAYPDRIAQARGGGRFVLRHGGGALLPDHDPLSTAPWLAVADVDGSVRADGRFDAQIRLAAEIELDEIERSCATQIVAEVRLDWDVTLDDLRATAARRLGSLVLESSRGPAPRGEATTDALVDHAVRTGLAGLGWTARSRSLQDRAGWARRMLGDEWPDVTDSALSQRAAIWLTPLLGGAQGRRDLERIDPGVEIRASLASRLHELDRLLPVTLALASGRLVPIDYRGDRPRVAVRVQEMFGTTSQPMVAGGRVPVTLELLSPANRPIQVTADLPGFWTGSWREVRRALAGRYPKHDWPDDPARAAPPRPPKRGSSRR